MEGECIVRERGAERARCSRPSSPITLSRPDTWRPRAGGEACVSGCCTASVGHARELRPAARNSALNFYTFTLADSF